MPIRLPQRAGHGCQSWTSYLEFLKGKCTIKIFDNHLKLKKRYWGKHFWAKGYCVSAVGFDEGEIRKYVKWQLEKTKRMEELKPWQ